MSVLTKFYEGLIAVGNFLQPFFLLAIRLFWGWQFVLAGLGKFSDIHATAGFFGSIGISPPLLQAYLAASCELVCGSLLVLGLASRLAALPLAATMIVAYMTAHHEAWVGAIQDPVHFVQEAPFTFLMAALTIFIFGPGKISIDALIKRWR